MRPFCVPSTCRGPRGGGHLRTGVSVHSYLAAQEDAYLPLTVRVTGESNFIQMSVHSAFVPPMEAEGEEEGASEAAEHVESPPRGSVTACYHSSLRR